MAVRMTVEHFKCWEHMELLAEPGKITLIKGSSGGGKTTIFKAIEWALYGAIRSVTPKHLDKAKTQVVLSFPFMTIDRRKNPPRLYVTDHGQSYEDKVAQALINESFGSPEVWRASCYVFQKKPNAFIEVSNAGKMDLLNSIAFHDQDPAAFVSRIDQALTESTTTHNIALGELNAGLAAFERDRVGVDISKQLDNNTIARLQSEVDAFRVKRAQLESAQRQYEVDTAVLNNLRAEIARLTALPAVVPPVPPVKLVPYLTLDNIPDIIPRLTRREELAVIGNRLRIMVGSFPPHSVPTELLSTAQAVADTETQRAFYLREATSLGLEYSIEGLSSGISSRKKMLDAQEYLHTNSEIQSLQAEMTRLNVPLTMLPVPEVVSQPVLPLDRSPFVTDKLQLELRCLLEARGVAQAKLSAALAERDILSCPHCQGGLRYMAGAIVKAHTTLDPGTLTSAQIDIARIQSEGATLEQRLRQINAEEREAERQHAMAVTQAQAAVGQQIQHIRGIELENERRKSAFAAAESQKVKIVGRISELHSKLSMSDNKLLSDIDSSKNNVPYLSPQDISRITGEIARIERLVLVPAPVIPSEIIRKALEHNKLKCDLEQHIMLEETHAATIPPQFSTLTAIELRAIYTAVTAYRQTCEQTQRILGERAALLDNALVKVKQAEASLGQDPRLELTRIIYSQEQLMTTIASGQRANAIIQQHQILQIKHQQVVNLISRLADLGTLKQLALDTECRVLQQVVDSINSSISAVCETLFDQDINLVLNLFKTLKTTGNVKPTVNFSIGYKGGTFDAVADLSGGEEDRCSLALTLALNRLSGCPLLLLDETLGGVSADMKEAALKTIRAHTDTIVLIIGHDSVEGIFDEIIDVDIKEGIIGVKYAG